MREATIGSAMPSTQTRVQVPAAAVVAEDRLERVDLVRPHELPESEEDHLRAVGHGRKYAASGAVVREQLRLSPPGDTTSADTARV